VLGILLTEATPRLEAQHTGKGRHVVIISIDGLPASAWEDPKFPAPLLRRLAREGVLAKGMTVSNPAVTWPNHTSMVTGVSPAKHGLLFNGLPVRQGDRAVVKVEQWRDKAELVQVPTIYDLAHQAGLTTAQVDWVAIQNAATITWEFPEIPSLKGVIEREMMAAGLITERDINEFTGGSTAWRDHYWTEAAVHIIKTHKPNLLLFHLLNTDTMNHKYGPASWASRSGYAYADACVGRVLAALESAGIKEASTVLLVSDHGFRTAGQSVRPNAVLREAGLLTEESGKIVCDAYALPYGGSAMVYVTNSSMRTQLLPRLKKLFVNAEGVQQVLEQQDFEALGMPHPRDSRRMGDLFLVAKSGYGFSYGHDGPSFVKIEVGSNLGHHGCLSTDPDMNATFLAWGSGIRPGVELGVVDNRDVAATAAALLGITMGSIEGRALDQILKTQPKDSQ
jgi:predicted AlkP superfamily pyrophosphatase or phosphodiesterase